MDFYALRKLTIVDFNKKKGVKLKVGRRSYYFVRSMYFSVLWDVNFNLPTEFNTATSDGGKIEIWEQSELVYLRNMSC